MTSLATTNDVVDIPVKHSTFSDHTFRLTLGQWRFCVRSQTHQILSRTAAIAISNCGFVSSAPADAIALEQ